MNFIEKNWKTLSFVSAGLIILGLIAALVSGLAESKEKKAQENFASLQTQLNQFKEQQSAKDSKVTFDTLKLKKDLEDFISKNPATVASQMAGLSLSDILVSEKNTTEALNVLKKVESNESVLSNILVLKKQAQLLADNDQCKDAITAWDKVLSNKKADYTFSDIQIKQALCYQKLNDTKKAEELLTKVKNNKTEGQEQSSLEAEKVLRLIQFNKTQGS
jgi:predicted negative regulator of RcsB-dependent stress response